MSDPIVISPRELVGKGYREFWNFKGRYRLVKGGRGSKKSTTTALWYIYHMMYYYHKYGLKPNLLVMRFDDSSHRNSTFAQLRWAISRLHVEHLWKATSSYLSLIYLPSGQQVLFRGMKRPESITSMTVEDGNLCWVWWEEASQFKNESEFNKIDLSIRGDIPAPLFKQHTITFNPWSDKLWIKARFFDKPNKDVLAITRNYDCNEWLDDSDRNIFETMRVEQPRRYAVEGRGEWGVSEGLIFENWEIKSFNADAMLRAISPKAYKPRYKKLFGMDFGFSKDPTAFVCLLVDEDQHEIYICNEFYKTGMVIEDMYSAICALDCQNEKIIADSASPLIIEELRRRGISNIRPSKKGPITDGIARLQDYKIFIHPNCKNAEAEFSQYCWRSDPKTGAVSNVPVDEWNHIIDAMRYATEGLGRVEFRWARA